MEARYPETAKLDRLIASGERDLVLRFLDWLYEEFEARGAVSPGAWVAAWRDDPRGPHLPQYLSPVVEGRDQIVAAFFGLDVRAIDRERQAMLRALTEG